MIQKHLAIVTDAWSPQINGVVRTLQKTITLLRDKGHDVGVFHPGMFRTIPMPFYPEISLTLNSYNFGTILDGAGIDTLHIATEGPLGIAAKLWADRRGYAYTTSYHTQFPEYVKARCGFGLGSAYAFMHWFHGRSQAVMVATPSMQATLEKRGIKRVVRWSRGVDTNVFQPSCDDSPMVEDMVWPIYLNVGRVAVEKNLPAFYDLDLPGTKVQVGDGPLLNTYRRRYPEVTFLGAVTGTNLSEIFRSADVFVFPSKTDTFGLVLLESIASGVPVAAYPVTGPIDVVVEGISGCLRDDLLAAASGALLLSWSPDEVRQCALPFSWQVCTDQFETNLVSLQSG